MLATSKHETRWDPRVRGQMGPERFRTQAEQPWFCVEGVGAAGDLPYEGGRTARSESSGRSSGNRRRPRPRPAPPSHERAHEERAPAPARRGLR